MDRYLALIDRSFQHPGPGLVLLIIVLAIAGFLVTAAHASAHLAVRLARASVNPSRS